MRIFQIAPISLPVRDDIGYGGTERVILYTDQEFTRMGHDSIIAASGDSRISGRLIPTIPQSQWKLKFASESKNGIREIGSSSQGKKFYGMHYKACMDFMLGEGEYSEERRPDIIHDHPGSGIITSEEYKKRGERMKIPILNTIHVKYDQSKEDNYKIWREVINDGRDVHFNAISHDQKNQFELNVGIDITEVIYHGIPIGMFPFEDKPQDYLFSIGRISPEKGQDIAIEIAKRTGRPLVIAGEVHSVNESYWKELVKPHIDGDQIRFIGPLNDKEKVRWFGNAAAFLMPIQWPEPFGLVMIESMATGTPVIAYNRGSVPEVVENSRTGFIVGETGKREGDLEEMVEAVNNLGRIDRKKCRQHVENNFTSRREAQNYIALYKRLIENSLISA